MSNRTKVCTWVIALVGGTLIWSGFIDMLTDQAYGWQRPASFIDTFATSLGIASPVLGVTAVVAFISAVVTRKRHLFMMTWTIMTLLALIIVSIGAVKFITVA